MSGTVAAGCCCSGGECSLTGVDLPTSVTATIAGESAPAIPEWLCADIVACTLDGVLPFAAGEYYSASLVATFDVAALTDSLANAGYTYVSASLVIAEAVVGFKAGYPQPGQPDCVAAATSPCCWVGGWRVRWDITTTPSSSIYLLWQAGDVPAADVDPYPISAVMSPGTEAAIQTALYGTYLLHRTSHCAECEPQPSPPCERGAPDICATFVID